MCRGGIDTSDGFQRNAQTSGRYIHFENERFVCQGEPAVSADLSRTYGGEAVEIGEAVGQDNRMRLELIVNPYKPEYHHDQNKKDCPEYNNCCNVDPLLISAIGKITIPIITLGRKLPYIAA